MATCLSAQERLRKEGAKMAEPTSIFSEAAAQAASTHVRSSTAASPEARPSSAQMPSRPTVSAVRARPGYIRERHACRQGVRDHYTDVDH